MRAKRLKAANRRRHLYWLETKNASKKLSMIQKKHR